MRIVLMILFILPFFDVRTMLKSNLFSSFRSRNIYLSLIKRYFYISIMFINENVLLQKEDLNDLVKCEKKK